MISTNLRLTFAAAAFALAGPALAQSSAPVSPPAPAAKSTQPASPAGATAPASSQDRRTGPARGAKDASSGAAKAPSGTAPTTGVGQPSASGAARTATPRPERQKGNPPGGRGLQNAYADVMTPEELVAHRAKVKSIKTYEDCRALFEATGKEMETRAKAQNKAARTSPAELCDRAKERGRVTG